MSERRTGDGPGQGIEEQPHWRREEGQPETKGQLKPGSCRRRGFSRAVVHNVISQDGNKDRGSGTAETRTSRQQPAGVVGTDARWQRAEE